MKVKSKIWLEKNGKLVFGEGKSKILKTIEETGSISRACKKMGISFRHGWSYITAIENRLGIKLIERQKGGKNGGGSCLTDYAKELIEKTEHLKKVVNKFADKKFKEIFNDKKSMCSKN